MTADRSSGLDDAVLDGSARDAVKLYAPPVIRHPQDNAVNILRRFEPHDSRPALARARALLLRLNAVIDGVANEMQERVVDGLDERLVELDVSARYLKLDFLPRRARR